MKNWTDQHASKHEWQIYQWKRLKRYQTEILEIKDSIEFINSRNDRCENGFGNQVHRVTWWYGQILKIKDSKKNSLSSYGTRWH